MKVHDRPDYAILAMLMLAGPAALLAEITVVGQPDDPVPETTTVRAVTHGLPMPDPKTEVLRLAVDLVDGSHIIGIPRIASVPVQTAYATMDIPLKLIASIKVREDNETAALELRNGDSLKGVLDIESWNLETVFGQVTVDLQTIVKLEVVVSGTGSGRGLVLWNRMGSDEEVLKSEVGPGLHFYKGSGWIDAQGDREYVAGKHGKAVTLKGVYERCSRVHNLVLGDLPKVLAPEAGCIEMWYWQSSAPVPYSHNYRLFDGAFGLASGMGFDVWGSEKGNPAAIRFRLGFGGKGCGVRYDIANVPNGQWVHLAASWNRKGIGGTADAIRLYVDGKKVAATAENEWGEVVGERADICGGQDANSGGKFRIDNLKVWNYAKTTFGDRHAK